MEIFLKYKTLILRILGSFLLLFSLLVQFWDNTKELTENEKATIRVARMEASVKGHGTRTQKTEPDASKFVKNIKNSQKQQAQYITIFSFIFGVGFLGYSFLGKKKEEE